MAATEPVVQPMNLTGRIAMVQSIRLTGRCLCGRRPTLMRRIASRIEDRWIRKHYSAPVHRMPMGD